MSRRLLDSQRSVCGLAKSNTDSAFFVADYYRGAKVKAPTARHNTRYAANADEFLGKFASSLLAASSSLPARASVAALPALKSLSFGSFEFRYGIFNRKFNNFRDNDLTGFFHYRLGHFMFSAHTLFSKLKF